MTKSTLTPAEQARIRAALKTVEATVTDALGVIGFRLLTPGSPLASLEGALRTTRACARGAGYRLDEVAEHSARLAARRKPRPRR